MRNKIWTTKEINELKQLIEEGYNRFEIAEMLGRSYESVKQKIYGLNLQVNKYSKYGNKIYAMYRKEERVTWGTLEEIAEEMNIKIETVKHYLTKSYLKRTSENAIRLVEVE